MMVLLDRYYELDTVGSWLFQILTSSSYLKFISRYARQYSLRILRGLRSGEQSAIEEACNALADILKSFH
jgi:hypothetical protein